MSAWASDPPDPATRTASVTPKSPAPHNHPGTCYAAPMRAAPPVLILSAALLTGCSTYQPPSFETVGVREVERTDEHAVLVFTVRATNPNREPMPLRRADYTVTLGGDTVFSGVRSPESTVDTYGVNTFDLPAVVPSALSGRTGELPYAIRGTVIYRRPGALADMLFDANITVPEATLDLTGTVNLGD